MLVGVDEVLKIIENEWNRVHREYSELDCMEYIELATLTRYEGAAAELLRVERLIKQLEGEEDDFS